MSVNFTTLGETGSIQDRLFLTIRYSPFIVKFEIVRIYFNTANHYVLILLRSRCYIIPLYYEKISPPPCTRIERRRTGDNGGGREGEG